MNTLPLPKGSLPRVAVFLLMVLLLASCWGEPQYPQQLVEADSLLMQSQYERADSMMQAYEPQGETYPVLMYRRLIDAGLQYKHDQLTTSFAVLDSLVRFYDGYGTPDKHVKAMLYLGYFYSKNHDYPAALNSYLQALTEAQDIGNTRLLAWIYNQIGWVYYVQAMFSECVEPYQLFYKYACESGDKRQMAIASNRMGIVYTYYSNVDSAIYSYMHAIELADGNSYEDDIVPFSKERLADIYIQIEEFDSAAMFLQRDTLNWLNWAYWHEAKGQNDSAAHYYRMSLQRETNLHNKLNFYKQLAQLDQGTGNLSASLADLKQVAALNDSIKQQSLETETRQAQAQHEYRQLEHERDRIAQWSHLIQIVSVALFLLLLLLLFGVWSTMKARSEKQKKEKARLELLRREEEDKYSKSQQHLEENRQRIAELESQLAEAQQHSDDATVNRLQIETDLLLAQNQNIEAQQKQQEQLETDFKNSYIYQRVVLQAGKQGFKLTDEQWKQLGRSIDATYNNFTTRLLSLARLSEQELQACYLVKLEVKPAAMAVMFRKSKSAISLMRQRMYKKLTGRTAPATDFDAFIQDF